MKSIGAYAENTITASSQRNGLFKFSRKAEIDFAITTADKADLN